MHFFGRQTNCGKLCTGIVSISGSSSGCGVSCWHPYSRAMLLCSRDRVQARPFDSNHVFLYCKQEAHFVGSLQICLVLFCVSFPTDRLKAAEVPAHLALWCPRTETVSLSGTSALQRLVWNWVANYLLCFAVSLHDSRLWFEAKFCWRKVPSNRTGQMVCVGGHFYSEWHGEYFFAPMFLVGVHWSRFERGRGGSCRRIVYHWVGTNWRVFRIRKVWSFLLFGCRCCGCCSMLSHLASGGMFMWFVCLYFSLSVCCVMSLFLARLAAICIWCASMFFFFAHRILRLCECCVCICEFLFAIALRGALFAEVLSPMRRTMLRSNWNLDWKLQTIATK